jgi:transposase
LALKRRRFTREVTRQVVRELEAGKPPAQAAREYQVHPTLIVRWRKAHQQDAERAFTGNVRLYRDEAHIAELARMIGQLTMENALLKKPCCGSKGNAAQRPALETADGRADG